MQAKLVIVGGKANKRDVLLKLPTIIGRSREADLTVAHPMVSRKHCELYEVDGLLTVRDLGSLNGTIVGGERITGPAPLPPDAEFTVGPLTFRVDYEYSGEIAAAPPVGEVEEEVPDFQVFDEELEEVEAEPDAPSDQAAAAGEPAGIAPPEGELPDFQAWGPADGDVNQVETERLGETEPPAPPPEEPVLLENPSGEDIEAVEAPEELDKESEEEPDFEAWDETQTKMAADLIGGGQPGPEPVPPHDTAEIEPPVEAKKSPPSLPRKEAPSGPAPQDKDTPAAGETAEELSEVLAGLNGSEAAGEDVEPEEEEEEDPIDQALNDFLKGLS